MEAIAVQGGRKPTKAERKEQARKKRLEELKRRQRKQRMRRIYGGGLALLAIAGIALIVIFSQQASNKRKEEINKLAADAGCTSVQSPKEQEAKHIGAQETFEYNTRPPSSGHHFAQTAPTGLHTQPIDARSYVHNLEHGNVVIVYKPDLDPNIISSLEVVVKDDPTRILVAPFIDMDYKVAMTAWGKLIGCNELNLKIDDLAKRFASDFKGKGPEGDIPGQPRAGG